MIKLYKNGAWLTEGQEPVSDETGLEQKFHLSKQEAKKNTIAYSILKNHNTSENMDFLKLKFDKLTSHDITFVGIIQTARAPDWRDFQFLMYLQIVTILCVQWAEPLTRMTMYSD